MSNTKRAVKQRRGLLFMCSHADIECQFEFIQQTWIAGPYFHGLGKENDPIVAPIRHDATCTIPTHRGPITLRDIPAFMTTRGGEILFFGEPERFAISVAAEIAAAFAPIVPATESRVIKFPDRWIE